LRGSGHGGVIWARTQTGPAALAGAARNELVLYRSISANGSAVAVSGTVSVPPGRAPKGGWPVITWDHGTTGIADVCAPSRDSIGDPAHTDIDYIYPLLGRWLKAGWAVLRTDYEGLGTPGVHPYLAGVSEAHSTLDMVRAARRLVPALGSRVIIAGHSQGGQAALWAAALAAKWTPELHVRGTVAFAPVSHLAVQAGAVRSVSTTSLSGDISLILRGIDTADPALHTGGLLTPQAAALYPQTLTRCLPQLGQPGSFGSLPASSFFRSDADLAPLIAALSARMDPDRLRIRTPVLIEQGAADGTVFPVFTQQLDQELTGLGDPVALHSYPGVTHGGIVVSAASDATSFIAARLAH
jgi:pimeloyl-ACP methyl ester carboxylesterase